MRLIALLLFLSIGSNAQVTNVITRFVNANATSSESVTPPPVPDPVNFYYTTITVNGGNPAHAFVYVPEGYNIPPVGGWPVVIFFGGDGTSNNTTTVVTGQAMSTSDNLTYTHSPSLGGFRMMCSSVDIKVNGVKVADGWPGGTITGTGVTGTITNFNVADATASTTPTVSATFSSSQAGNTITYDYVYTTTMIEGPMRFANLGDDFDNRCIIICIQNRVNTNDYHRDYWDNTVTYAWNNFNINPNRIYAAGISRGGRQIIDQFSNGSNTSVLKTRYVFWINRSTGAIVTTNPSDPVNYAQSGLAALVVGTASYAGTFTGANITDIGQLIVHATVDGVLTNNTPTYSSTLGSINEPPFILNWPGPFVGSSHSYELWDNQLYNRQWRTDATGTALFDWVDFLLKYSKDPLERATLFVEQAEKRRYGTEKDIIDYRHALRQTNALSSSSEKTALLARLTTLKGEIDNGGTRWVINFHSSGQSESGNYVNFASSTAGTTVSNIVDFDGNSSTLDVELDTDPGGGMAAIASTRRSYTGGFSKTANNSGLVLTGWPFGTFKMTGVPSGTYTVRFYHNVGVADFSTDPRIRVTLNSETKSGYSGINTLIGYIEFTGVPHTALAQFDTSYDTSANTTLTMIELYKHP